MPDINQQLLDAARAGTLSTVSSLLEAGAEINFQNESDQDSVLHKAVWTGNKELIKFLLAKKANINAQNKEGNTPLHSALRFYPSNVDIAIYP